MSNLTFPRFKAIDGNGNPIRGGKLYTYAVGTSNNKATYSDYALSVAHANPVVLNSEGEALIYLATAGYKMNLLTSADAQVPGWPVDNIYQGLTDNSTVTNFTVEHTAAGLHGGKFIWRKGADVASGAALALGTDGNYFDITGVTGITSINTLGVGTVVKLHFDGALLLTHNATDLVLPGSANITTVAGDEFEFIEYASADWRLIGGNSVSLGRLHVLGNVIWSKGADVVSAAALALGTDGNYFDITGAVTITSINTIGVGTTVRLHFDAALTLTHHATDLVLPHSRNITTVAGDELEFTEYATGDWRLTGGHTVSITRLTVGASSGAPWGNTLYAESLVKGWVAFNDAGTVLDSFNVSSVTDSADVGDFVVVWNTDFSNVNYAVAGMALHPGADTGVSVSLDQAVGAPLVGSVAISIRDAAGAGAESTWVMVIADGDQAY